MSIPENEPTFLIHQFDERGFYTGESRAITKYDGIPFRWTRAELPTEPIPEGKILYLNGRQWEIIDIPPVPEPEIVIPSVVTPRQARLVLALQPAPEESGFSTMLQFIEAEFDNLPEPDKTIASITWEYSTEVQRSNPLIAQVAIIANLTEEQLDQLFLQASTL